ncbi:MAG: thiamine diphosphokinase [Acidimicrobiales bacterium]|nr:thiamine diphosphokinase [Acidimicrobiales bacterium]
MTGDEQSTNTTATRVLLFVGGDPEFALPTDSDRPLLDASGGAEAGGAVLVVAADSGLDRALVLGVSVDHVVGDMDSVSPRALEAAVRSGAIVHRHEADKDATDLELALDLAVELTQTVTGGRIPGIHVVGGGGGRLDHLLGDVMLLAAPRLAAFTVTARFGPARLAVVRPDLPTTFDGSPGTVVSLLPIHGEAYGVTTTGLRWALTDGDLAAGTTRAVSNEMIGGPATVSLRAGTLAVVLPGTGTGRRNGIAPRTGPYDPAPRLVPEGGEPTGEPTQQPSRAGALHDEADVNPEPEEK